MYKQLEDLDQCGEEQKEEPEDDQEHRTGDASEGHTGSGSDGGLVGRSRIWRGGGLNIFHRGHRGFGKILVLGIGLLGHRDSFSIKLQGGRCTPPP